MRINRYDDYVAAEVVETENIYEKEYYDDPEMRDYIKENHEEDLRDYLIRE